MKSVHASSPWSAFQTPCVSGLRTGSLGRSALQQTPSSSARHAIGVKQTQSWLPKICRQCVQGRLGSRPAWTACGPKFKGGLGRQVANYKGMETLPLAFNAKRTPCSVSARHHEGNEHLSFWLATVLIPLTPPLQEVNLDPKVTFLLQDPENKVRLSVKQARTL